MPIRSRPLQLRGAECRFSDLEVAACDTVEPRGLRDRSGAGSGVKRCERGATLTRRGRGSRNRQLRQSSCEHRAVLPRFAGITRAIEGANLIREARVIYLPRECVEPSRRRVGRCGARPCDECAAGGQRVVVATCSLESGARRRGGSNRIRWGGLDGRAL